MSQIHVASLDDLASKIIRRENIDYSDIESSSKVLRLTSDVSQCYPRGLHNAAIIRGRQVQVALDSSEPDEFDLERNRAVQGIRRSLSCAPSDSFLWFVLFWLQNFERGLQPENIALLRRSYELGPYEGWIALKRCKVALTVYAFLPDDLRENVRTEFSVLVGSGFVYDAADLLVGSGWSARDDLLLATAQTREKYRRQLAKRLREMGIEVSVPGIELQEWRPWQVN
ncbi:hypothetical protein JQ621_33035 [Bradyrhizobium manausense]|uniref:hypothetical protein n=1 Tax=Bradyrhizobium manausense TaxID=989370 RepID=UPI001BA45B70|nr:hypothetical protein [Bradyrhizobium manausense]MBR1092296.1 hypothetical protein [Bradyrhizobium manausense]